MKPNVMDTIQGKLPSQKGKMDIMEVLKRGLESRKTGMPFPMFAAMVGARLQSPRNSIIQINNSAFLVSRDPKNDKKVEFSMISADHPSALPQSISGFYKFLKTQGILSAETTEDSPVHVNPYKAAGIPVKVGMTKDFYGTEQRPAYAISFDMRGAA